MTECRYRFFSYCVLPKGHDGDHSDTPLGYEVRPIGKPEDYAEVRGMFSAAVALARCTCGSLDSVHSPTCARAVAAAVAPLEPIPTDWGVGPLTHPAAVAHDPTICTGTDAVPCGCVCFDCNERGIHQAAEAADPRENERAWDRARQSVRPPTQAAEAADREAAGAARDSERTRTSAAVAQPTSSAEVGGSLDVERLLFTISGCSTWEEAREIIAAAYADAIRKRGGA